MSSFEIGLARSCENYQEKRAWREEKSIFKQEWTQGPLLKFVCLPRVWVDCLECFWSSCKWLWLMSGKISQGHHWQTERRSQSVWNCARGRWSSPSGSSLRSQSEKRNIELRVLLFLFISGHLPVHFLALGALLLCNLSAFVTLKGYLRYLGRRLP